MTPVERALSASRRPMTLREIGLQTGLDHDEITAQLRALSDAENLEFIPARGHHAKSYTLKSTPAGAMPDAQLQVAQNSSSAGSGSLSPEAGAVAIENPEPEAATPPSRAEGSGGDVWMSPEMQYMAENDYKPLPADSALPAGANREIATALDGKSPACGYVVLAAKRKPLRFAKIENARAAALSAIRAGEPRAEVFVLVRVGVAKKGAEWVES